MRLAFGSFCLRYGRVRSRPGPVQLAWCNGPGPGVVAAGPGARLLPVTIYVHAGVMETW